MQTLIAIAWLGFAASAAGAPPGGEGYGLESVEQVQLAPEFWWERVRLVQQRSLPALYSHLEAMGYLANFRVAAGAEGQHNGRPEADGEVYGWIEAAALTLDSHPDPGLRSQVSALIEEIAAAQGEDGYLNTCMQLLRPKRRYRELQGSLELYSTGRLIRAGLAWRRTTGEARLFEVGLAAAREVAGKFGPGKIADPPGRSSIEGALVKLADATGDEHWADLALYFIEARGDARRKKRYGGELQDEMRILEERLAVGFAEGGLALYGAVAEVARTRGYEDFWDSAQTIWDDIAGRKMYITGGVGSRGPRGSFGSAYDLPLETAYCSSAAAAGFLDLNQSLLLATGHAVGADLVELVLYNSLIAGLSLDGTSCSQRNPLVSGGEWQRQPILEELSSVGAVARCLASLDTLVYAHTEDRVYLNQYIASSATISLAGGDLELVMETDYPESGFVQLEFEPARRLSFTLCVRVPGWCSEAVTLGVNDVLHEVRVSHGHDRGTWLEFEREWIAGDTFTIQFPMLPRRVTAPRRVSREGLVALGRGPEIYCFEEQDCGVPLAQAFLPATGKLECRWEGALLGGVHIIEAQGQRRVPRGAVPLAADGEQVPTDAEQAGVPLEAASESALPSVPQLLRAVPYARWGNRTPGSMVVWLAATAEVALPPAPEEE